MPKSVPRSGKALFLLVGWLVLLGIAARPAAAGSGDMCGGAARWFLSADGLLTVRGSGAMYDYLNANTAPWYGRRYQIRSVLIEEGVTAVGNYAFANCPNLISLTVGGGLRAIGDYAFAACPNLADVLIGGGARALSIGLNAFNGCKALEGIALPDNTASIGQAAFAYCESLREIQIPPDVRELPPSVFRRCYALESVVLPEGLESVGQRAFGDCEALESIALPVRVGRIGAYAFENCVSLTEISIPARVGEVPEGLCSGCAGLRQIFFSNSLQTVHDRAFSGCGALADIYYNGSRIRWSGLLMTEFRAQIARDHIAVHCTDDTAGFASLIAGIAADGQRVFITLSGEQGGEIALCTAFYDPKGRLLGTRVQPTQAPESGSEREYTVIAFRGAASVKAFLLWPDSRPAAEAVRRDMEP